MDLINIRTVEEMFSGVGKGIFLSAEQTVSGLGMGKYIESGVLIGLSGGADSVMLLCFLAEYRRRRGMDFPIVAVHVNHMIRGEEADRDEEFSRRFCERIGVEFIARHIDVPFLAERFHMSIEEAARKYRYYEFDKIISGRDDISTIAVAHNMSDNAETVIFNVLRGSGARGAAGIPPVRDNIIRPLIKVSKADILLALDGSGIPYVTDSTNLSDDYSRNYIRQNIIPSLNRITSDPEEMLCRFAENMRSDDDFIRDCAEKFILEHEEIKNTDLLSLHNSVYARVLAIMAGKSGGAVSYKIAADIRALLCKDNFSYSLIGKATFICERGVCRVSRNLGETVNYCFEVGEGITDLSPLNAQFVMSKEKVEKTFSNVYKISIQANLSSAIINGSLYLRPKKDGDTVYYSGMTHKLKKLFSDRKIPPSKRRLVPILCDDKGVVWVPGFGVRDDGVKPDDRRDVYVLLGITPDVESDGDRLYSASEFRS